ncbi:uncharacterized protein LOC111708261 [Eurytemora carolleeae]|uniref:uncharacterized protein LOC111708261 n=1 Tax=Eurytemora carolleeae TaxID=1294199 RepID=UPI000C766F6E|nr:uncharacterized protein LOC111708261 [Eurytemora carolleeae]|eukprot:XP_023337354.1 uncharacterized protein LOC111708261 [Eurytemora affinis]
MADSKWLNIYSLALLTLGYIIGELAHFLIATTSPEVAKDIHYGDLGCRGDKEFDCEEFKTADTCTSNCTWDYLGTGLEYQVLAGPAFIVTFTFSALIMGFLADNFSRPLILSAAITVFSVCCMLMGFSQSYWQLVVLRMGIALGEGACRPASGSLIAEFFGPENRAKANGVFSWGVYYGYGLAFIFGIYITQADILGYGWRSAYVMAGAPGLIIAALLIFIKDPRYKVKNDQASVENKSALEESGPKFSLRNYLISIKKGFWQPAMICLLLSAAVRHTAGYSWANNNFNYFNTYHEGKEIGYWFMICSIVGGGCGVVFGGIFSDILVKRMGISSRQCQVNIFIYSTDIVPDNVRSIYLYILEIVPDNVRSITVSTFLFIMNNLGGNIPILIEVVAEWIELKPALYMFWPGLVGLSGVMFALSSFTLPAQHKEIK